MEEASNIANRFASRALLGMLALAFLFALSMLCLGLFQPLLDLFSFRQTQTALTAYWLVRGGPIFAYETPMGGYPWSIPFEFPVYQIIVAILSASGVPLDAAGRIVSFGFFVGCLWPMRVLFRLMRLDDITFPCVAILFLLSPLYLFWSRTFMIETCALFFSLCWLAYLVSYFTEKKPAFVAIAIITGTLGILSKATTFPAFAFLGGLIFLKESHNAWTVGLTSAKLRPLLLASVAFVVPFSVAVVWTIYSDMVKVHNELGALLTSRHLTRWIFGTWDQRISLSLWRDVVLGSTLDTFGYGAIPAIAIVGASSMRLEYALATLAALLAFLVPFIVFTNLHMHSYYQTANAIFLIAAAGFGIASAMSTKRVGLAFACLAFVVAGQVMYFCSTYAVLLTRDVSSNPLLGPVFRIADMAKSATAPGTSLIVIGDDYSSRIPYYAQRKSFVMPELMPVSSWKEVFEAPQKFLGDVRLGGIVYCADTAPKDTERKALVDEFVAARAIVADAGRCRLLAPAKN